MAKSLAVFGQCPASFALIGTSACVQPQQVEVLEREQRQLKTENAIQQKQLDVTRASLADTRANLQQVQRDISSLKEMIEEPDIKSAGKSIIPAGREISESKISKEDSLN